MGERTILIVDDEEDIIDLLSYKLTKENFVVHAARTGEECLEKVKESRPDLILLDVMMPGISGIEVCKTLKESKDYQNIPVIMLTARSTESDIISGLNCGADDYVTKPFSIKVLLARINAMLRREIKEEETVESINLGPLSVNFRTREVFLDGKELELTFSRFEILSLFIKNPNTVFSRKDIIKIIKGDDYPVTERAIDVHIVDLRRHLGDFGKHIETVRGMGYKFEYNE